MSQIIALSKALVFAVALLFSTTLLAAPGTPAGVWKTIDDDTGKAKSLIEISEHDGVFEGKIVKLFRTPSEEQNPLCRKCIGAQHDLPILGMTILTGLKKDGELWDDSEILDPNNGKFYHCKATLIDDGRKMELRGFIGISLFGRTQVWERQQEGS